MQEGKHLLRFYVSGGVGVFGGWTRNAHSFELLVFTDVIAFLPMLLFCQDHFLNFPFCFRIDLQA